MLCPLCGAKTFATLSSTEDFYVVCVIQRWILSRNKLDGPVQEISYSVIGMILHFLIQKTIAFFNKTWFYFKKCIKRNIHKWKNMHTAWCWYWFVRRGVCFLRLKRQMHQALAWICMLLKLTWNYFFWSCIARLERRVVESNLCKNDFTTQWSLTFAFQNVK